MTIHDLYGRLKGMLIMFSGIEDELMWNKFDESHGLPPMREEKRIIEGLHKAIENYDKALDKFISHEADANVFQTKTLLDDIEGTRRYADDAIEVYGRLMKETVSPANKEEIRGLLERIIRRANNLLEVASPMIEGTYIVRRKKKLGVDWKEEFLLYPIDTTFLDGMKENKMKTKTDRRLLKESDMPEKLRSIEFLIPDPDDCDIDDDGFWVAGFFGYSDGRYDYLLEKMLDDDFDDTCDVLKFTFVRNNRKKDRIYWFNSISHLYEVIDEDTFPDYPWLYGIIYDACLDRVDDFCRKHFKTGLDEIA